jgi:hypothetical protein
MSIARRDPRDPAPRAVVPFPAAPRQSAAIRTKGGIVAPLVRRWPLGLGDRLPPVSRLRAPSAVPRDSRIVLRGLYLR